MNMLIEVYLIIWSILSMEYMYFNKLWHSFLNPRQDIFLTDI